ncbi:acyltransferase [Arthrobacter sp. AOP36-C1-22]|uniref:acyltransferase n=1 Tax=Arthrobacter sp. AOP36-C1-22 TaxID=3457683 RepID=UPI00403357EF
MRASEMIRGALGKAKNIGRYAVRSGRRCRSFAWSLELCRAGTVVGQRVRVEGRPITSVAGGSHIKIGNRVVLCSKSRATALGVSRPVILRTLLSGAKITIGDDTGLSGTTICAAGSITIGARCLIGADVLIADTDFHPIDVEPRRYSAMPLWQEQDAVVIGDDVFIGARALILKGVEIGRGAVIGAGSVVTQNVLPGSVYAGVPARLIRAVATDECVT